MTFFEVGCAILFIFTSLFVLVFLWRLFRILCLEMSSNE